ncbi:hypothetical protein PO909_033783 [Leuciscus waleckii]
MSTLVVQKGPWLSLQRGPGEQWEERILTTLIASSIASRQQCAVRERNQAASCTSCPVEPGHYSPYFILPKKGGGLRQILDLRVLNRSLHKLPFKMLTQKHIFECIRPQDWFAAIDLKDAYFHVSILPRHRPFLRFVFKGRAYQYKVLPFRLALSPRVFTKVTEGALVAMREQGVRILNYLDDWLILAHSRDQLCEHRDLVLRHLSQLGLQVNWEKSKLAPVQRISFLGMELDSVTQTARLTEQRAQSVLNSLNTFKGRTAVPLKFFQRLLGHMAAAAAVTLLGLFHMRPLQHWVHGRVPRWAWHHGTHRVAITSECRQTFSPWSDPSFLWAGVPLEQGRHSPPPHSPPPLVSGPSGPCSSFQSPCVLGPFQARPSCSGGHMSQASGAHGSSLSCAALGSPSYETIPVLDETQGHPPFLVCLPPAESVAQLLSRSLEVERLPLFTSGGQDGCSLPLAGCHDGRLFDLWGAVFEGRPAYDVWTGEPLSWHINCLKLQAVSLALDQFLPAMMDSCHCQDGQHGSDVPCKSPGGLVVAHPRQACAPPPPLGSRQVSFAESSSRSRGPEHRSGLSVETEAQVGGMDVALLNSGSNLEHVWRGRPLCVAELNTVPPMVFPVSAHPTPLWIDALAHPWLELRLYVFPLVKRIHAVLCRVRECGIRLLLVAPFWPSQTWFSELSSLVDESPWQIPIRRDPLSHLQGRNWHP